jgi:hypothetical protein
VQDTGRSLEDIVGAIRRLSQTIGAISDASREQAAGVDEIAAAISSMDEITQQNSAMAEQSATAVRRLADQAHTLEDRIGFFSIGAMPDLVAFETDRLADTRAAHGRVAGGRSGVRQLDGGARRP